MEDTWFQPWFNTVYTSKSRITIDKLGNVGVGTTQPQYKFHVKENDDSSSPTNVEANIESNYGVPKLSFSSINDNDNQVLGEINFNNYNGSNNDLLVPLAGIRSELFSPTSIQGFPTSDDDGADLVFYTSESSNTSTTSTGIQDRMKLRHDGKLEINVGNLSNNSVSKLHVKGGVELNDLTASNGAENEALLLNNTDLVVSRVLDNVAFTGEVDGSVTNELQDLTFDATTNELSLTNSSQNVDLSVLSFWDRNATSGFLYPSTLTDEVGIGTSSPDAKLEVVNPSDGENEAIHVKNYKESGIRYGLRSFISSASSSTSTSATYGIFNDVYTYPNSSGGNYGFYNRIYSYGSGTSYGIYNRSILQAAYSGSSSVYGIYSYLSGGTNHTGNIYGLYLRNNGTTTGTEYGIYTLGEDRNYFQGDVGIGTSAPAEKLHVAGNAKISSGYLNVGGTESSTRRYEMKEFVRTSQFNIEDETQSFELYESKGVTNNTTLPR